MLSTNKKSGVVRNVKFLVRNDKTVRVWIPVNVEFDDFKPTCDCVIKYLIDEGFITSKSCRVEVVK